MQLVTDKKLEAYNNALLGPPHLWDLYEIHFGGSLYQCLQFAKCIASLLHYCRSSAPLFNISVCRNEVDDVTLKSNFLVLHFFNGENWLFA